MEYERTLKSEFCVEGVGLHTGRLARVVVKSAPEGKGIVFVRRDLDPPVEIPAVIENVEEFPPPVSSHEDPVPENQEQGHFLGGRQTSLYSQGARVRTIEHLMAAFYGMGIDNALVEIEGEELPGLDGSAQGFVEWIEKAGVETQRRPRRFFSLPYTLHLESPQGIMILLPSSDLSVSYTLSYNGEKGVEDQFFSVTVTSESFIREIAPARTFCLKEEAEVVLAMGLGKGASLENTLVFDGGSPVGNTLRFKEEAARHKVLDLLGDLYLLGRPIRGHLITFRTGHRQNQEFVRLLRRVQMQAEQMIPPPASEQESASDPGENFSMASSRGHSSRGEPPVYRNLDRKAVEQILPHRYPFLFVDRILELIPGKRAVGLKKITPEDYYFEGHFPGHPIMPGVLIIEALAQVGGVALLSLEENIGKIAYFMSIDSAKFRQPVLPGDELRLEADVLRSRARSGQCMGKAYVDDRLVAEAQLKFAVIDRERTPLG